MKFISRFGIVGKIMSGYLTILLVSMVVMSFCLLSLYNNRNMDKQVSEVYYPALLFLKDVSSFTDESNSLTNNWVYQPSAKDKDRLKFLHANEYVRLTEEMSNIVSEIQNESEKETMSGISKNLQQFLLSEKLVMDKLSTDEAYGNDVTVDEAITILEKNVKVDYQTLQKSLGTAVELQNSQLKNAIEKKNGSYNSINGAMILSIIVFAGIIGAASWYSINTIQKPVKELSTQISELATGKFVSINSQKRDDEIGLMTQAISGMVTGLQQKADFASKIGVGRNHQFRNCCF